MTRSVASSTAPRSTSRNGRHPHASRTATSSTSPDGWGQGALVDRAVPIELDGRHGDVSPFALLDDLADRARIAFLVEMDHFIAEKSEFRLLCIRYLASRGWRFFGEEVDWRVGQRLDRFLTSGTESMLEPLVEAPWYQRGILAGPTSRQDDTAMQLDRGWLVRNVRDAVPGARWFGFDVGATDTDYLAAANAATTWEDLRPVMARREQLIHQRVGELLRAHPREKVALMAGSTHLAKNDDVIDTPNVIGPGGGVVHSIGHHVAHDLTDEAVLSIWFLHGSGRSDNPYLVPPGSLVAAPGTLNAELLHRVGRPCLVPVNDDDREWRSITQMHNAVLHCRLAEQVDAIIFAPVVTPISERQ